MPRVKRGPKNAHGRSSRAQAAASRLHSPMQQRHSPIKRYASLLDKNHPSRLRIGIDFGTGNSSGAFVVVDSRNDPMLQLIKRIQVLHTTDGSFRFPTLVAFLPMEEEGKEKTDRAELVFAQDALDALYQGRINFDDMIVYPKLGLIDDFRGIFDYDKATLEKLQRRHNKAIANAKVFELITIKYPGGEEEECVKGSLNCMEEIIARCLKYFLHLMKSELGRRLEVDPEEVDWILKHKTEVGFAAPTFWTDTMLDNFLRLIQDAGWPTHCKIWSEPKCALSARVAQQVESYSREQREKLETEELGVARVVVDIGAGSLVGDSLSNSWVRPFRSHRPDPSAMVKSFVGRLA